MSEIAAERTIQKRISNLPVKLEDLTRFVLVGREALVACRAAIRAIDKIGVAKGVREQKLEEGQMLGGALLDAEAKIGDLLKDIPKQGDKGYGSPGGTIPTLPDGITKKQSHYYQQLAEHPDLIEQEKAEAAENEHRGGTATGGSSHQLPRSKRNDLGQLSGDGYLEGTVGSLPEGIYKAGLRAKR
jgi:hypothetical protein